MTGRAAADRRRGWTLVEITILLTVAGGISLASASWTIALMQIDTEAALAAANSLSVERLERQFRHDVHAARTVEIVNAETPQQQVQLSLDDDSVITYAVEEEGVRWTRTGPDGRRANDVFVLAPGSIRFQHEPPILELHYIPKPSVEAPGSERESSNAGEGVRQSQHHRRNSEILIQARVGLLADHTSGQEGR